MLGSFLFGLRRQIGSISLVGALGIVVLSAIYLISERRQEGYEAQGAHAVRLRTIGLQLDRDLLDASGILPHEQVDVLNITTGARFTTYAIEAPRGSRVIGVNGAAARLVQKVDKVIVVTYGMLPEEEARNYAPRVVLLDEGNEIKKAA